MNTSGDSRLLRRDFVLLWQGQLVSQLGSQAFAIATAFWIKHATGSAGLVGLMMMLGTLPIVILSPLGGVVADIAPRKRIIVACDAVAGAAVLVLALAMWRRPDATAFVAATMAVASAVMGVARAFFAPALRAALPALAPPSRLAAANALHEGTTEAAALLGQAAGGFAFRVLGAPVLLVIDGLSYLAAALCTSLIRLPQERPAPAAGLAAAARGMRADFAAGVRFVRGQRGLGLLVALSAAVNVLAAPVFVMLPFFAEDSLGAGAGLYGVLVAALGAGGLAGFALAARTGAGARQSHLLLASLAVIALCLAALAWARSPAPAVALCAAAGVANGFFGVRVVTLLQARTPDAMRGRVFGLLHTLAMGLAPVAMLVTGLVADAADLDARTVFRACGLVLVAVTGAAWLSRGLRAFLEMPRAGAS